MPTGRMAFRCSSWSTWHLLLIEGRAQRDYRRLRRRPRVLRHQGQLSCPGFTATYLNNLQGTRTVEEGAREPVRLALLDANGPTGTFSNEDGPLPW